MDTEDLSTSFDKLWLITDERHFYLSGITLPNLTIYEKLIDRVLLLLPILSSDIRTTIVSSPEYLKFVYPILRPRSRKNSHPGRLLSSKENTRRTQPDISDRLSANSFTPLFLLAANDLVIARCPLFFFTTDQPAWYMSQTAVAEEN